MTAEHPLTAGAKDDHRLPRALATVVLTWVAAPLVLVIALTLVAQQQSVFGAQEPMWVSASDAGTSSDRQVELVLEWGEPVQVFAPAWTGTVGEVLVSAGSTLKSGDPVARIDGVVRLAWHTEAPFYRQLTVGDRGTDVAALNRLLESRSLPSTRGDRFTWATRRGTAMLAHDLGARENRGVFDPGMVMFLAADEIELTHVELSVGGLAPAHGEVVLVGKPPLRGALLVEAGSADATRTAPVTAIPAETLIVDDVAIELNESRAEAADASLALLSDLADAGQERIAAVLVRELPDGSVEIPAAAVHTDRKNSTCVAVRRDDAQSVVRVEVVGGLAGRAVVTGAIAKDDLIGLGVLEATDLCAS